MAVLANTVRAAAISDIGILLTDMPGYMRDYIHVEDLAKAYELALGYMETHEGAHAFNLGGGQGFSVQEVMAAAEQVTGRRVPYKMAPRRAGDPAVLVASSARARRELGGNRSTTI